MGRVKLGKITFAEEFTLEVYSEEYGYENLPVGDAIDTWADFFESDYNIHGWTMPEYTIRNIDYDYRITDPMKEIDYRSHYTITEDSTGPQTL